MRSLISIGHHCHIRAFLSNVKFNKIVISPEPVAAMAARGPEVGGQSMSVRRSPVSRLANPSNECQMVCPLLFRSRKLWKIMIAQGLSEEAQCIQGAI